MSPALSPRAAWPMLLALTAAFGMSQAFRTMAAILAPPLQAEFGLSPQQIGLFAASFHFAFGALQLLIGVGMDLFGLRRTVLTAFPLTVLGAGLSAGSHSYEALIAGQVLIGIGCAPAFLACTLFIAQQFPGERFAMLSGLTLMLGGIGMLVTGSPLAWLIEARSWRAGMWVLAAGAALAWVLVWWRVRPPPPAAPPQGRESLGQALRGFGALLLLPYTWGIMLMGAANYASFMALRGLWLGPLLIDRHGLSLVASGHVALAVSVVSLLSPPLFGRFDPPSARRRRRLIVGCALATAALFALIGLLRGLLADTVLALAVALLSGFMVLQYADVRAAYPPAVIGRALSVFTMAMFIGVALVQWGSGWVASQAAARGADPFAAALLAVAAMLALGALAYRLLPQPPQRA
ncbi:MAG: MFS transporter [Proteobacteria bacterium]|nr:MFS transporter [Pseudomonadota bacterium]